MELVRVVPAYNLWINGMATPSSTSIVTNFSDDPNVSNSINSLLMGTKWGSGAVGTAANISYSFPSSSSDLYWSYDYTSDPYGETKQGFRGLNATEQTAFAGAMQAWADVANINVTKINSETSSSVGDIRVAYSSGGYMDASTIAYTYTLNPASYGGDIWINNNSSVIPSSYSVGADGYHVFLHEIGHALGLEHPFEGVYTLPSNLDNYKYTVMSYSSSAGQLDYGNNSYYPTGPMLLDIQAIQYLYGANMTYHTGNDVYAFNDSTSYYQTIWDAGGTDTIQYTGNNNAIINLNAGTFSTLGKPITLSGSITQYDNVAIAYNVTIENAIGGNGNDTIYGNAANNVIDGGAGNDTLEGNDGNDVLNGGTGADVMRGGMGNDTYYVDNRNDLVEETWLPHFDLVSSTYSYSQKAVASADGNFITFLAGQVIVKNMETGQTWLASTNQLGEPANNYIPSTTISADGRYVVFETNADNLTPETKSLLGDVYLKDLYTGQIKWVSSNQNNDFPTSQLFASGWSVSSSISPDGRYVVFASIADNLVANDSSVYFDEFIKDTQTGAVRLVNTDSNNNQLDIALVSRAVMSADNRYVAYLGSADTEHINFGIYVKDLVTNELKIDDLSEQIPHGYFQDSSQISISADGRYIVFQSAADHLVPNDVAANQDVFRKDMLTGEIKLVSSVNGVSSTGDSHAFLNAISADGRYVVFSSTSNALVDKDTNGYEDVFIKDMQLDKIVRVSINQNGNQDNHPSLEASISSDGKYIIFTGNYDSLVGGNSTNGNSNIDIIRVKNPFEGLLSGNDTVNSSISYTLTDYVENLTLTGNSAINGTGNQADNIITGNSNANILKGGTGNDTLNGDLGNDTLNGGLGNDQAIYHGNINEYKFTYNKGLIMIKDINPINGDEGTDTLTDIESAVFTNKTFNFDINRLSYIAANKDLILAFGTNTEAGYKHYIEHGFTEGRNLNFNTLNYIASYTDLINTYGTTHNDLATKHYIAHGFAEGRTITFDTNWYIAKYADIYEAFGDNKDAATSYYIDKGHLDNHPYAVNDDDVLTGHNTNDTLNGYGGNDTLIGGLGNDTLYGGTGNDILDGGTGADRLIGGTGNDTYIVDNVGDTATEDANAGIDTIQSSISFNLASRGINVENLTLTGTAVWVLGNDLNNVITGNNVNNNLQGGAGNDTLNGGAGNDFLYGGTGNDVLDGGTGADKLIGGTGNDTYIVDNVGDTVTEDANAGIDTIQSSISFNLASRGINVENLTLTGTAVWVLGNDLNNVITGNNVNNNLQGGAGNDTLNGGAGNDFLDGGTGEDKLIGGTGNDVLTGGIGADVFDWNLVDINNSGPIARDTVKDFNLSQGDKLDLKDLLVGENSGNILNYLDITTSTSGSITNTEIRISNDGQFAGGTYNSAAENQHITLAGLDLLSGTNETNLLASLINNNQILIG
jgi:serralysin